MKTSKILYSLAAIALAQVSLQAVETNPVGFVSVTVPANSDAILAVPLNRAATFTGVVNAVAGNVITVTGTPGWTANQLVFNGPADAGTDQLNTYALQLASGAKEGLIGKITANGTGTNPTVTITLDAGEDLTGVLAGDQLDILPYWTPSTLIPSASVPADSSILLLATSAAGVNLSSIGILSFDGTNWFDEGFSVADHSPLFFGQAFILRTGNSQANISMVGSVPMNKHRVKLQIAAANTDQDIAVGYSSPVPTPIGSSGLGFSDGDSLLVFNNSAAGINKSASTILSYSVADGGWLDEGFNVVNTTYILQPGQGYILRKAGVASTSSITWTQLQTYLQ